MSFDQLEQLENCYYNVTAYPRVDQVDDLLEKTQLTEKELKVCVNRNIVIVLKVY